MKKSLLSLGLLLALSSAAFAQGAPNNVASLDNPPGYILPPPSQSLNQPSRLVLPQLSNIPILNRLFENNNRFPRPLGIALETLSYPSPVKYLPLENEGQSLRMAFMDVVPPENVKLNGRAVVLLHGKNFGGDYWRSTMYALTNAGFRVVVPDQIGFGKSSKPDLNYSFDLLAANTARLLDELKIERAAIVGHSMGGMLAVRFARNYPERVSNLILENPIGLEDYRFVIPAKTTAFWTQRELENTDPAKITAFYRDYFVNPENKFDYLAAPRIGVTQSGEYPRWAKAAALTYQMIYQQPVRHEFALLKVPTLLVIGQEDRTAIGKDLVSPEVAQTLGNYPALGKAAARDIPGAQLVELPNIGHIPHIEAPAAWHAVLLKFLQ